MLVVSDVKLLMFTGTQDGSVVGIADLLGKGDLVGDCDGYNDGTTD